MMLLVNVIMQLYYSVHSLNTYEALAAHRLINQIPESLYPSLLNGLVELNLRSLEQQFGVNLRARPRDLRIRQRVPEGDNDPIIHEEHEPLNSGRQQQEVLRDVNAEEPLGNEQNENNLNIEAIQVVSEEEKVEELYEIEEEAKVEESKDKEFHIDEVTEGPNISQLSNINESILFQKEDQPLKGIGSHLGEEIKNELERSDHDISLQDHEDKDFNDYKMEDNSGVCSLPEEEKVAPYNEALEKNIGNFDLSFETHKSSPNNTEKESLTHINVHFENVKEKTTKLNKETKAVYNNGDGENHNEDMEENIDG